MSGYLDYFQMQRTPFALAPDLRFHYDVPSQRGSLEQIISLLQTQEARILISGSKGVGKTLLLDRFASQFNDRFTVLRISASTLNNTPVWAVFAEQIGVMQATTLSSTAYEVVQQAVLEKQLSGHPVVLIIDDAEQLDTAACTDLQYILKLQNAGCLLVQCIMAATGATQHLCDMANYQMECVPLRRTEIVAYCQHRLLVAGHPHGQLLSKRAISFIARCTCGTPLAINQVLSRALLRAYQQGADVLTPKTLYLAAQEALVKPSMKKTLGRHSGVTVLLAIVIVAFVVLNKTLL